MTQMRYMDKDIKNLAIAKYFICLFYNLFTRFSMELTPDHTFAIPIVPAGYLYFQQLTGKIVQLPA